MALALNKQYEDEHVSIWTDSHIVVIYYFGEVYEAHIETIRGIFSKVYSDFGKLSYLSIVGQSARPPTNTQRKAFLSMLDSHRAKTTTANWLLTKGFRGSFVRSVLAAMSVLKPGQKMKVFLDGSEACEWLGQSDVESGELHEAALKVIDRVTQRRQVVV